MGREVAGPARWRAGQRVRRIRLPLALWLLVPCAHAQFPVAAVAEKTPVGAADAFLPPIGGPGETQFLARCPQGWLLRGLRLRTGDDVDAILPLCSIAYGPVQTAAGHHPQARLQTPTPDDGPLTGGLSQRILDCPLNAPIVTGLHLRSEGRNTVVVNSVHLFCGVAGTVQTPAEYPAAVFDGPSLPDAAGPAGTSRCPAGLVAVGVHGKSGTWLDALGLICGEPVLGKSPFRELDRVDVSPASPAPRSLRPSLYWLGFDIATGLFGDPALGALGNTATGPGSLKIRYALSDAGQRGFNASAALHLSRSYKH